jgi:gliding motility-associated-like protein
LIDTTSFIELPFINNSTAVFTRRFTLQATSRSTGCSDTASVLVSINPLPVSTAIADTSICAGSSLVLGRAALSGNVYRWQGSAGVLALLSDTTVSEAVFTAPDVLADSSVVLHLLTTHAVTGCFIIDSVTVHIRALPRVGVVLDTTVCAGQGLALSGSSSIAAVRWQWQESGRTLSTSGSWVYDTPSPTDTSFTTLMVMATDLVTGCSSVEKSIRVRILPVLNPDLSGNNRWLCPDVENRVVYSITGSRGSTYSWQAAGALSISPGPAPNQVTVLWQQGAGAYSLTATETTSEGCRAETTLPLFIDQFLNQSPLCRPEDYPLSIPNVISPNADGLNDALVIDNAQYYPDLTFKLYNRYGVLLLDKVGMAEPWHPSTDLTGTFFYLVNTGRGGVLKGFLEVVR